VGVFVCGMRGRCKKVLRKKPLVEIWDKEKKEWILNKS